MRILLLTGAIASPLAMKLWVLSRDFTASLSCPWVHTADWLPNLNRRKANRCSSPCRPKYFPPLMCFCDSPSVQVILQHGLLGVFSPSHVHRDTGRCRRLHCGVFEERFKEQTAASVFSLLAHSRNSKQNFGGVARCYARVAERLCAQLMRSRWCVQEGVWRLSGAEVKPLRLCVHVPLNYNSLRMLLWGWSMSCKAALTSALHVVVEVKVKVSPVTQ